MMSEEFTKISQHWLFKSCFSVMDQVIYASYSDTPPLACFNRSPWKVGQRGEA